MVVLRRGQDRRHSKGGYATVAVEEVEAADRRVLIKGGNDIGTSVVVCPHRVGRNVVVAD